VTIWDGVWIVSWIYWITCNYSYSVSQCTHFTTQHKAGNGSSACVPLQPTLLSVFPGPRTSCRPNSSSLTGSPWPSTNSELQTDLSQVKVTLRPTISRSVHLGVEPHRCVASRYQATRSSSVDSVDPSSLQRTHHSIYTFLRKYDFTIGQHLLLFSCDLFYDAVVTSDCIALNGLEVSARGLFETPSPNFPGGAEENCEKTQYNQCPGRAPPEYKSRAWPPR
jgi:hypothetical protein